MPGLFIRIIPFVILFIFAFRFFLLSLWPNLFKPDYGKIDDKREEIFDKIQALKDKAKIKPKAKTQPEPWSMPQKVTDEGATILYEFGDIKVRYTKTFLISNIFMVVSLYPKLHAKSRFAEGRCGLITLKNAQRLKQKYPGLMTPRGFKSRVDDEDVEQYYLIYAVPAAEKLKDKLEMAHKDMFNTQERIHIQIKGILLEYKEGWVNGHPVKNPIEAQVLYLQFAELIHAYNTDKVPSDEMLVMEKEDVARTEV